MSRSSFRVNPHSIVSLNVKKLFAWCRRHTWCLSDSNEIWTHSHYVRKRNPWTWDVGARNGVKWEFSPLFNPVYLFDNKACTWKRGHGRHWYVQKEPHQKEVDIWNYVKTCISFYVFVLFIYLFACLIIFLHFKNLQSLIYVS